MQMSHLCFRLFGLLHFYPKALFSCSYFPWFLYNQAVDGFEIEIKQSGKGFYSGNMGIYHSGKSAGQN